MGPRDHTPAPRGHTPAPPHLHHHASPPPHPLQALGRLEWMAGDLERARAVWRQGETVAGPSSLLGHTWAVLELRSGKCV